MRRTSTRATRAIGLIALAAGPAFSQESPGTGVLIRPPAEVGPAGADAPSTEVHPAPPAPTTPPIDPTATAGSTRPAGPSLAIDPRAGAVVPRPESGRGPRSSPFDGIVPGIESPAVEVRPPLIGPATPMGEGLGPGTAPLAGSPSISPPLNAREEGEPPANPLLPPGPGPERSGRDSSRFEDRERRPRPASIPQDRPRPGLLGGFFGRLLDRPASPMPTPSRVDGAGGPASESARAAASAAGRDDPIAVEAIRSDLERRVIAAAGDRISTLEVLIVGRRVHIRAESARLWQRRALRRDLEAIPMPSGFRPSVEVR